MARTVFDLAARQGVTLTLLDIGGGFPGWDGTEYVYDKAVDKEEVVGSSSGGEDAPPPLSLAKIAEVTIPVLDELFPPGSGVQVRKIPQLAGIICTCYNYSCEGRSEEDADKTKNVT